MIREDSKNVGKSTLDDRPEYVRAIGMISILNAGLEHSLATLFSRMLSINVGVGHAIYLTPKSALARVEILQNAARVALGQRGDAEHQRKLKLALRRVNAIADRAKKLIGKRHGIIHDAWGVDKETGNVHRHELGFPSRKTPIPIADLNRIVDDFRKLISDTRTLSRDFQKSPPTLVSMRSVAGQIDLVFAATGLPFVRAGSIKAYAVTSDARLALAPDIPTFAEIGMPALSFSAWAGLFAPRGTPKDIIGKLNAAVVEALADPAVRSRIVELGCRRNEGSRERRLTASTTAARFARIEMPGCAR
jgi:hypothetical protein